VSETETATATQDAPAAPATESTPSASQEAPAATAAASQTTVAETAQPEAEQDFRVLYEKAEKERIPALMSERDRASNDAKQYKSRAESIAQEFEGWIEFGASRGLTAEQLLEKIRGSKAQVESRQRDTQAQQSETVSAINALYRSGETAFAAFVEGLRDAEPTLRVTPESIAKFRKTFDAIAPASATAATAAAVTAGVKTPPKTPTPAGAPSGPEPVWKGPKTKGKDLLRTWVGRA
jgi:hypothetical protein